MGTLQLVLQILKLDSSRGLSDDIGLGKVLNPVEGGVGEGIETVWRGRGCHDPESGRYRCFRWPRCRFK